MLGNCDNQEEGSTEDKHWVLCIYSFLTSLKKKKKKNHPDLMILLLSQRDQNQKNWNKELNTWIIEKILYE